MTTETIPSHHERLPQLTNTLIERGALGVVVIDASSLGLIEYKYGTGAYEEVRQRVFRTLTEASGKDLREGDLLALESPLGVNVLMFPDAKRRRAVSVNVTDLKALRTRLLATVAPNIARAAFPYLKSAPRIEVGCGMAIHNPLVHPARLLDRARTDALAQAAHFRRAAGLAILEALQDTIVRERVTTAYQPILSLEARTILGFEALSRGSRGNPLESADDLFSAAAEHQYLVELDRLCRKRALLNSSRIPSNSKLFINTLPATIRDPEFRGKLLIDFLERAQVAPQRIVLEITEKLVIENYGLFQEAMAYFSDLGMSFAVDDVGAGYSGLEAIARLKPAFLKIDIALVRDVHVSLVNREMVKAIVSLGHGIGSAVIAEGIHSEDEARTLVETGVDFGQGYHLARPDPGVE